ncbi:SLAM family member 9-like isoform X2 [Triplophysa dalaica]|nr:SLAM family member 9-like isoform X2 [Triplophysa dalaica]
MEGDSVTLHIDDKHHTDSAHLMLWTFVTQGSPIVRINKEANKVSIFADVHDGMFRDRLQVDDQTGSLNITNITTQHSGLYHITISGKQQISYRFDVTVYAHLPVPVISRGSTQCSSSNCSVLCSVLNVSHVSLSWYKGKSLLSNISVSDLNIRLSLPLEVEYQDTNTYRCVINNPITNHTQHLHITQHCHPCSGLTFIHKVVMCCAAVASLKIVTVLLIICVCRKHRVNER